MSIVKCRHPYTEIMVIAVISERDETDGGQVQFSLAKLLKWQLRRLSWWKQAAKYRVRLSFACIFLCSAACWCRKVAVSGENRRTRVLCSHTTEWWIMEMIISVLFGALSGSEGSRP